MDKAMWAVIQDAIKNTNTEAGLAEFQAKAPEYMRLLLHDLHELSKANERMQLAGEMLLSRPNVYYGKRYCTWCGYEEPSHRGDCPARNFVRAQS